MAVYVVSEDLKTMARNIQRKFTHNFGDLNLDKIAFLKELETPSKSKVTVTKQIDPATKVVHGEYDYLIIIFAKRWDAEDITPAQKNLHLMQAMFKCKWDGDGLRKYDVNDFYELASAFGADWPYNSEVRDPMAPGEIKLVSKPVPPEADDEEDEALTIEEE